MGGKRWKPGEITKEAHFYLHVQKARVDECWPWKAFVRPDGYGWYCPPDALGGGNFQAHRYSLELKLGRKLLPGMLALHIRECKNRHCVNPHHLYEGTAKENTQDKFACGYVHTSSRGSLTPSQVMSIYNRVKHGAIYDLAEEFNVAYMVIWSIATGRTYKQVTGGIRKW